jgi:hypothetical protein
MLQVHSQQIHLHEVHLLEHSHCSVSKVGLYTDLATLFVSSSRDRLVTKDILPLLTLLSAVYTKLGYHWATTLLAFLTLVMAPFP